MDALGSPHMSADPIQVKGVRRSLGRERHARGAPDRCTSRSCASVGLARFAGVRHPLDIW